MSDNITINPMASKNPNHAGYQPISTNPNASAKITESATGALPIKPTYTAVNIIKSVAKTSAP